MRARRPTALADHENVLDLGQGQAQPGSLPDEPQHVGRIVAIDAVAVLRAPRRWQDALPLVEADRLGRHPGPARQLADRESAIHVADQPKPFPLGEGQAARISPVSGRPGTRLRPICHNLMGQISLQRLLELCSKGLIK